MDAEHDNVRRLLEEDRLSGLPDELIHKILSSFDMKFVVQTCLLSPRWKLLWTSMPFLNFSSEKFPTLPKFSKFVTDVLSHRNHQTQVSSINLTGAATQDVVRTIANYAYSHNIQELTVTCYHKDNHELPPCLFSSQSLKHFRLCPSPMSTCVTPKTPWYFPALTALYLSNITLCDDTTQESLDLFSKCVNLKDLTLYRFDVGDVEVFNIITPRLSNLMLINGTFSKVINLVAPQLENLTISKCETNLSHDSSLRFSDSVPPQLSKDRFHSLNKVTVCLSPYCLNKAYKEEDARRTINMLQEFHSAKYLTLNTEIVECISSFPDLLIRHSSPFSNLICLTLDSTVEKDAYQVMSAQAINFFLGNSPGARFIMKGLGSK